jgi:hypothetical protein
MGRTAGGVAWEEGVGASLVPGIGSSLNADGRAWEHVGSRPEAGVLPLDGDAEMAGARAGSGDAGGVEAIDFTDAADDGGRSATKRKREERAATFDADDFVLRPRLGRGGRLVIDRVGTTDKLKTAAMDARLSLRARQRSALLRRQKVWARLGVHATRDMVTRLDDVIGVLSPPTAMHTREVYGYAGDMDDLHALYCHLLRHHSRSGTAVVSSAAMYVDADAARYAPASSQQVKVRGMASALTSLSRYTIVEGRPAAERARSDARSVSVLDAAALSGLSASEGPQRAGDATQVLPGDRLATCASDFGTGFDLLADLDEGGSSATAHVPLGSERASDRDAYGIPIAGAHVSAARFACFADDGDALRIPQAHFTAVLKDILAGTLLTASHAGTKRPPPTAEDLARRPTDVRGLSTTLSLSDGKTPDGKFSDVADAIAYDSDEDADITLHGFGASADIVAGVMRDLFNESQLEQLVAQIPLTGLLGLAQ